MKTLFVGLIAFTTCLGCAVTKHMAVYDIGLTGVERPVDATERYGETTIAKVDTGKVGKYVFTDDLVRIVWSFTPSQISFDLLNKTDHSIKIIWDEAAYLDANGQSHRVMHGGIKYTDKEKPQPPSVVVRGGRVHDIIVPTSYVNYESKEYGYGSAWNEERFFEPTAAETPRPLEKAKDHIDKVVQVLLPLEVQGVVNEYLFMFKVNDVTLITKKVPVF